MSMLNGRPLQLVQQNLPINNNQEQLEGVEEEEVIARKFVIGMRVMIK
jgi:hypothetical protein